MSKVAAHSDHDDQAGFFYYLWSEGKGRRLQGKERNFPHPSPLKRKVFTPLRDALLGLGLILYFKFSLQLLNT